MIDSKPFEPSNNLADRAALSADHAIRSTQRVANETLDGMAGTVQNMRHQVAPVLSRAAERANALAQRSVDAVRDGTQHLRERALQASDGTVNYIKGEPVKSMLIAAVTGAALMALISLMTRSPRERR